MILEVEKKPKVALCRKCTAQVVSTTRRLAKNAHVTNVRERVE